jgi:diketogulonate reductase-like aldo/keto reductase
MKVPDLKLADGHTIPQVALGTWQNKDEAEFQTAFKAAIEAVYRHFDSAQAYDNEQYLGNAWQQSGLKREELFITTKIAVQHFGYRTAKESFAESLKKLQSDYVDLLLLHFPVPVLRKKTWQALEEIQAEGGARSIGVSNYTIRHLREMESYAKVKPVVNQVELHVFLQQPELVKYCQENDIIIEAYSPLARGRVMDNPAITQIAQKHGKSYAQIMLRWLIEQGFVILPKSVTPERIRQNIDIFDFKLDAADLKLLAAQDQNLRTCWSPVHVP